MVHKRLIRLCHFEWLSRAISPVPAVSPVDWFPESDSDWQAVITLGSSHLVLPILCKSLQTKGLWPQVPEEVATALEGFYELNQQHNSRLRHQMLDVTRTLNSQSIRPVWLKGATRLLEPDWQQSTRMMLDLDFWLPVPVMHPAALHALSVDNYNIPEEYAGVSDTEGHHFLRRMKPGLPAGIEIHRDLVGAPGNQMLTNESALKKVEWFEWEGLPIGVLNQADQCLHSYIQCTEMNSSGLLLGQIKLMKAHDFLLRYQSLSESDKNELLGMLQKPCWKQRAEGFFTYIDKFFGMKTRLPFNDCVVKRVKANYEPTICLNPRSMMIRYNIVLLSELILQRKLGAPRQWLGKAKRLIQRCIEYRPEF